MSKVEHGGDIYQYDGELIDFSSNINPLGLPNSAKEILEGDWKHLKRYPDIEYRGLKESICHHLEVDYQQVLVGNGAAEIIFLIGQLFKDKKVLIPQPTFGEYQQAVEVGGGEFVEVYRHEEDGFKLPIEGISDRLAEVDGLILCNPNNPTGNLLNAEEVETILEKTREAGVTLIIDEAFIDFVPDPGESSFLTWLDRYPHLLIIRAYTKFYAMPGLRLGYAVGATKLISQLKERQMPWSVNSLAAKIGEEVLTDRDYLLQSRQWIDEESRFLLQKLATIPQITVFQSMANFILCKIKEGRLGSDELKELMIEEGILIRDASTFTGLDNSYFRLAIKDRKSNKRVYKSLKRVLADG